MRGRPLGLIRRVWTAAGRGYAAYDEEMRKHFQTRGQRWLIWAHAWGVVIGLAFVAFMFTIFVFWSVAGFPDVFD